MDTKKFLKKEGLAFGIVNVCLILLAICLIVWKAFPWIQQMFAPCTIATYLHVYCPGCGGTRAMYSLVNLHLWRSFVLHPLVMYCAVIFLEYYIGEIITLIVHNGKRYYYLHVWMLYASIGVILLNWIVKNVLLIGFHIDLIGDLVQYW